MFSFWRDGTRQIGFAILMRVLPPPPLLLVATELKLSRLVVVVVVVEEDCRSSSTIFSKTPPLSLEVLSMSGLLPVVTVVVPVIECRCVSSEAIMYVRHGWTDNVYRMHD